MENLVSLAGQLKTICEHAAKAIVEIYQRNDAHISVSKKTDQSPVTEADLAANQIIIRGLKAVDSGHDHVH